MAQNKTYHYLRSDLPNDNYFSIMQALSQEDRAEIIALCQQGKKITEVREQFPEIPLGAFDMFIPLILSKEKCEICEGAVYERYHRKTNKKSLHKVGKICIDCGHNFEPDCTCSSCNEKAENLWHHYLDTSFPEPFDYLELNPQQKVELFYLLSTYRDSQYSFLRFYNESPSHHYYRSNDTYDTLGRSLDTIVLGLKRVGILKPAPQFNRDVIFLKEDGSAELRTQGVTGLLWDININLNGSKLSLQNFLDIEFNAEEKSIIWRSIYLSEVAQYLNHQAQDIFNFKFNEIMVDFITDLFIEKYALSQACSLIYYSMSMSLRYMAKYKTTKQNVTSNFRNNLMRNMERFDRAKANHFNRPSYVVSSPLNRFILDNILMVKGEYFSTYTENIIPGYVSFMDGEN